LEKIIKGKGFVLGDNIDTDQIISAEHLVYSLSDPEESKKYGHFALSGVPINSAGLPKGGIPFIKGEHAPFALNVAGAEAIIAESYARIFYRNCVDGGFLIPYETPRKLNDKIKTGDELEIDLNENTIKNVTSGESYKLGPLGDVLPIIEAGNIFEYARQNGMMV
jgi:3-isopropylmalate/(R)-2-methylmalate dehydratase small subunit